MANSGVTGTTCAINHVALSVDDLDQAVQWYTENLGFCEIIPSAYMDREKDPKGIVFRVYGGELHKVKVAYLEASNSVGFEIFQFIDPKSEAGTVQQPTRFDARSWTQGGFFHVAVTAAEPQKLASKIEDAGGRRVGDAVTLSNGHTALYVQDPWGNAIEICSTNFFDLITSANRHG
ncbi:hypothetical protein PV08_08942 [Exophiala spinifera]|uniref:VOC domain-containing protein n=1 Tax=Exophiala spinifera TaxID=91928 RepID=A0A0D1YF80_9EURO|nr:uncharacterized protein PV08_08942 [Exophiala spinifera]KIW13751.1 hypothetical protein PV08_08942 [Exophiala spinifera]